MCEVPSFGVRQLLREGEGARCSASTEEVAGYCLTQTQEGGDREENRPTMRRCDGDATGYGEQRWRFPPMRRSGFDGNGLVGAAFFLVWAELVRGSRRRKRERKAGESLDLCVSRWEEPRRWRMMPCGGGKKMQ